MKCIRLGIIGCGWIVRKVYIPLLKESNQFEIVAFCDIDTTLADKLRSDFPDIKFFNNIDCFLEVNIDAVIISTPNYTHYEFVKKSLNKNKHVLCEKPITTQTWEINELIGIAKTNNLIFLPGFANRFRDDVQKMVNILESGILGLPHKIQAKWLRRQGIPKPGSWFTQKELSGGGVLMDLGPHIIDVCMLLCKENEFLSGELQKTYSHLSMDKIPSNWYNQEINDAPIIDVEDSIIAKLKFSNNLLIDLDISWLAPVENDFTFFKIECEFGVIELRTLFGFSPNRLWENDSLLLTKNGKTELYSFDIQSNQSFVAFKRLLNYFYEVIINGKNAKFSYLDGLKNVNVIETLYKQ